MKAWTELASLQAYTDRLASGAVPSGSPRLGANEDGEAAARTGARVLLQVRAHDTAEERLAT